MAHEEILDEWRTLIEKAKKDITKLIPVKKQVTRNGKTVMTTVYVSPKEAEAIKERPKKEEKTKQGQGVNIQEHLRPIRKALGTEKYKEYLKANGIKWEHSDNSGADTMRASSAAKKWIEAGNKLDEDMYHRMLKGEPAVKKDEPKKEEPKLIVKDEPKKEAPKPEEPKPAEPTHKKDFKKGEKILINNKGKKIPATIHGKSPEDGKWRVILEDGSRKKVHEDNLEKAPKEEAPKPVQEPKKEEKKVKEDINKDFNDYVQGKGLKAGIYLTSRLGMNFAKLSSMGDENAVIVGRNVNRFFKKFPEIKSTLKVIGLHEDVREHAKKKLKDQKKMSLSTWYSNNTRMSKNTHAYHITFSGPSQSTTEQFNGIHFNKELFGAGNETHGNKEMKSLKRQNWLVSDTLEGTVIHELGHAVHKALKPKIDRELKPYYGSLKGKDIVDGLSKYGKTSYDEFIAEAFSEYYNSDNPRPIAKKVGEVFESLAKIKN